ncbi:MAG: hypothetical protein IJH55_04575, partial [Romboutsia sp.]|nr:hypothetical protein [Romboutsia sp.]
ALRSVIVFPICLIILSLALGADGIWVSTLVSESITIVVMILVSMDTEDGYVVIRVKDDGIGIPKENRENVFNVFVQGGSL